MPAVAKANAVNETTVRVWWKELAVNGQPASCYRVAYHPSSREDIISTQANNNNALVEIVNRFACDLDCIT